MRKEKVLYLSYDGLTDPLGQSQVLPYIIGLSKYQYEFTVVSFEKSESLKRLADEIATICAENKITWVALKYHKWPPILSTLYDVWRLWQQVKKITKHTGVSIIHCRSYITSIIGLHAKLKWKVRFIFDMRGFWADERVEGGLWNLKNPLYKMVYDFFKNKEKQFLRKADHVVSLTHNGKQEIESWGITNAPITVIPTCVDLSLFDPTKIKREDQDELRLKLGIREGDYVLLYLGSWGTWYLTKEMFDFFSALKKEKANAKFLIVSADKIELDGNPNKNDVIVTRAPRHLVPLYVSLADLSVLLIKTSFSKKASSATKMGETLAMGIPVVTNAGWGDVNLFVLQGANIEIWRGGAITEPSEKKKQPNFVRQTLSLEHGVSTYKRIYESLTYRT